MFGMSRILVERRFKNLRDICKRKQQEVRDKQRSGAGVADIPTIKWPHLEAMLELTEVEPEPVVNHLHVVMAEDFERLGSEEAMAVACLMH
ncbi:hypothetical protein MRX96_020977 [Rhipicephalus microplus]